MPAKTHQASAIHAGLNVVRVTALPRIWMDIVGTCK